MDKAATELLKAHFALCGDLALAKAHSIITVNLLIDSDKCPVGVAFWTKVKNRLQSMEL